MILAGWVLRERAVCMCLFSLEVFSSCIASKRFFFSSHIMGFGTVALYLCGWVVGGRGDDFESVGCSFAILAIYLY